MRVQLLDDQTKEYVQNSNANGIQYAMNKLQDVEPAQASAIQDLRSKPQFYVMKVPQGHPAPPDTVVVAENEASKYPTRNLFDQAETLVAKEDTAEQHIIPSKLLTSPASYYVQAGTFGVEGNARKLADRIERDYNAKIVRLMLGERQLYRVMIGPYAEHNHAKSTLSRLNSIGVADAKITRD